MATIKHHSDFLSALASIYKPRVYVELGLYVGETINKVSPWCEQAYGVDTKLDRVYVDDNYKHKINLYQGTTDTFFTEIWNKNKTIDMAFIDADHKAESAFRDLQNVLKYLTPGGVVIMHDTDPISEFYKDPGLCGDSYRLVSIIEKDPMLNIVTIPIEEAGLSMITRKDETRTCIRDNNTLPKNY